MKKISKKAGLIPRTLVHIGEKKTEKVRITIIATIFIPLTSITGIYGMNFQYMPELRWRWSYFGVLFVMVIMGIGMVNYFRIKKWL
ncbi:MAG: hypothetical protein COT45_00085 [bacterium (Candidatus Stahlbacteria) CG08_land_8_20_14_0_20_40_26]|nr:MAG: hypothetical protein COX49_00570 [bacterium (Candidatus Stahlbacteria) CG23_combo_of_CG06-09_8_20_14_all_40_9]PIS26919.1 MAG: hypothetical protein COT45_00085 [bacterium (Candidatus Stahlbacteria) CG08_land_8_20_14_0_20_40_26]